MTCASCQHHVEEALRSTAGVESARVDLMAHRASVVFDPASPRPKRLVEAIRGAGYDAVLPRPGESGSCPRDELDRPKPEVKAVTMLAAGAWPCCWPCRSARDGRARSCADARAALALCAAAGPRCAGFLLILTASCVVWAGAASYSSAIRALRHGTTNMNTLVAWERAWPFVYSAYATIWPAPGRQVYFDAVLLILGFLLLGKAWKPAPSAARWPRSIRSRACGPSPRAASSTASKRWCRSRKFSPATRAGSSRRALSGGRDDSRRPHHGGRIDADRRIDAAGARAGRPRAGRLAQLRRRGGVPGASRWARPRCWRRLRAWWSRRRARARPWSGWPTAPARSLCPWCWRWR